LFIIEGKENMQVLKRKDISARGVPEIYDPSSLEIRAPRALELVLVMDENPKPYGPGLKGLGLEGVSPVFVLGVREKDSLDQPSMWRDGYIVIPGEACLFISPVASKYFPETLFHLLFEWLDSAELVLKLKQDLTKKGFVH
jgi:hypothetical protein